MEGGNGWVLVRMIKRGGTRSSRFIGNSNALEGLEGGMAWPIAEIKTE